MSLWQAVEQAVDPGARGFLVGIGSAGAIITALLALIYRGFATGVRSLREEVQRLLSRVDSFYDDFSKNLKEHEIDDNRRFGYVERDANKRHEEMMGTVDRHANAMTAAAHALQLEFAELRGRLPDRRTGEPGAVMPDRRT